MISRLAAALAAAALVGVPMAAQTKTAERLPDLAELKRLSARFAPVDLVVDLSKLPENERQSLARQIEAARILDALFLRQVWSGNEAMLLDLAGHTTPLDAARRETFLLHKGPWDRIEHNRALLPGAPAKPAAANFYPADTTKEEVEAWIRSLPEAQAAEARGFFHVVRRSAGGKLVTVPYSVEYQAELARAAALLREAAKSTRQPTLAAFLEKRAEAFGSNDYYASDVAWMELDASLEPTIGPYEVYEDEWFNYKAAFEAFITVRDDDETAKLQKFSGRLQELENALPIDAALRNPKLGAMAPIRVVNVVYTAGDANRGVQTAAFNLPNDERVLREKGAKRVMLKNVQQAKFEKVLVPISRVALTGSDQAKVAFDPFFTHILMHELMHGLGPHDIEKDGQRTTVRQAMKELSGALEEAKADVSGLWALQYLVDHGVIDKKMEETMYVTFLASSFRTLRFGLSEAHGRGMALQLNYFLDHGAVKVGAGGTFAVDPARMKVAVRDLTAEIMNVQAKGDYAAAKAMLDRGTVLGPDVQRVLDRLSEIPVDIAPRFVTADVVAGGGSGS